MDIRKWKNKEKEKELLVGRHWIEAGHKGIGEISIQGMWAKKMEASELLMYRMKLHITERRVVAMAGTVKNMKGLNDQKSQNERNCLHLIFCHVINSK